MPFLFKPSTKIKYSGNTCSQQIVHVYYHTRHGNHRNTYYDELIAQKFALQGSLDLSTNNALHYPGLEVRTLVLNLFALFPWGIRRQKREAHILELPKSRMRGVLPPYNPTSPVLYSGQQYQSQPPTHAILTRLFVVFFSLSR